MKRQAGSLAAPRFVIYGDKYLNTGAPPVTDLDGWNVFAIAFWINSAQDNAGTWAGLTADQRTTIKNEYSAAGVRLIVSAFGSTSTPTSSGEDAIGTADSLAAWVKQYDLDGADVDYEDFNAFNGGTGSAETWLISFTNELRKQLPEPYIITHAPVAPWFTDGTNPSTGALYYPGGGYLKVDQQAGSAIDWYNIQFYNQGVQPNPTEYEDCTTLLTKSINWPHASVFEIAANGVPLDKLVIGKPAAASGDANNGYMDPATTLHDCVTQAKAQGWNAGLMTWQYPDAPNGWLEDAWGTLPARTPTGGGGGTTTTPPTSGGICSGVPAWSSGTVFTGGQQATYNGDLWTAKWWTEGDTPGGSAGAWTDNGACTTSKRGMALPTGAANAA